MNEIKIRRLSENGLTTHEYIFSITPYTFKLTYSSYFIYHRDEDGLFSWENPRFIHVMTYEQWCEAANYDYCPSDDDDANFPSEYQAYESYVNPILHKTKDGRPLKKGISASIKKLPKCPQDVAEEALELARKKLVVKYE